MPPGFEESIELPDWKCCFGSESKNLTFDMMSINLLVIRISSEAHD